ncbi:MAG: G8 domain-containing protein [Pseudomonadota bacterium]
MMMHSHDMDDAVESVSWTYAATHFVTERGDVVIPKGVVVSLDQDATVDGALVIHGSLEVRDTSDLTLHVDNLIVFGELEAGTPLEPHTHLFEIVLTGRESDPKVVLANWVEGQADHSMHEEGVQSPDMHGHSGHDHMNEAFHSKMLIAAPGAKVSLHGAEAKSWTQLDGTVSAGANTISVLDASGWKVGDKIAIAPTDFNSFEVEDRFIQSINDGVITLDAPLQFQHYGEQQELENGKILDMRGEVANLSRNIRIIGEEDPEAREIANSSTKEGHTARDGYGGHTVFLNDTEVSIDGVEFSQLGISGELGRYPVHFHHGGDQSGSYVRDVSVHDTFQRGIVVHATDNLLLEDNVVYDTIGHSYYIEDGTETGNLFSGNLAMLPRSTPRENRVDDITMVHTIVDERASAFWITNVGNDFIDNHAVGVPGGQGFWFSRPDQKFPDAKGHPGKKAPFGTFDGNTAHTIEHDASISPLLTYGPHWTGVALDVHGRAQDGDQIPINDFTAWKVTNMAISAGRNAPDVENAILADARAYVHTPMAIGGKNAILTNPIVIAKTDNNPDTRDMAQFYDDLIGWGDFDGPYIATGSRSVEFRGLQLADPENVLAVSNSHRYFDGVVLRPNADGEGVSRVENLPQELRYGDEDDIIFGYGGNDHLMGQKGDDIVVGGAGNDRISGHSGDDILVGGSGDDVLTAKGSGVMRGAQSDIYFGGIGDDYLKVKNNKESDATIVFRKGDGLDRVEGFSPHTDKFVLIGYSEDDLDKNEDGAFTDSDVELLFEDRVKIHHASVEWTLNLVNGDGLILKGQSYSLKNISTDNFEFYPDSSEASGDIAVALSYHALDYEALIFTGGDLYNDGVAAQDIKDLRDDVDWSFTKIKRIDDFELVAKGTRDADQIVGSSGSDHLRSGSGDDVIYGLEGTDKVRAGKGNDEIFAGAGDDRLFGEQGNDIIWGGEGRDRLSGQHGDDLLYGEKGDDNLWGGKGDDLLVGGAGDDWFRGGKGADVLVGGSGHDLYDLRGGDSDDTVVISGADVGHDQVNRFTLGRDFLKIASEWLSSVSVSRAGNSSVVLQFDDYNSVGVNFDRSAKLSKYTDEELFDAMLARDTDLDLAISGAESLYY